MAITDAESVGGEGVTCDAAMGERAAGHMTCDRVEDQAYRVAP